ncbi:RNA polymerase sigma factor [Nocardia bovistercoris]|uniref:RNA polymerase sigma factor n=1 Tax=Nocardia bovistercoris TaxID=2785916 RepID=A0A931IEV5_9NOCA|nr:RNA polymerase sigma factor [Nocardia bovistercoris]MBH0778510.1 RNA polymerase sigma factor [Nocardia bovistercoris]
MNDTATRRGDADSVRRSVAAVWRIESAKIIATLTRAVGDFGLAEDLAQEALVEALDRWPQTGVPKNPGAWLTTVAKRRAVDRWRREERYEQRLASIARELEDERDDAAPWDPDHIDDDVLRLVFVACHPVLAREAQVALTLRVVGGLSTEDIAQACLTSTATVQQRIVRAKKTLAAASVPFEVPPRVDFGPRLAGVLGVLYLMFNEGYAASRGDSWMRLELGREALRLGRVLAGLVPDEPEAHGLVALMELTAARFPARTDINGDPVLLADQDRRRWDRGCITRGRAALRKVDALGRGRSSYALQATIAECHALANSIEETDWERIVLVYDALGRIAPSPVVELNRAAAIAMTEGPAAALRIVDAITTRGALPRYHLLPATRGELLSRLGRHEEARRDFESAAKLAGNERERDLLLRKAAAADLPH